MLNKTEELESYLAEHRDVLDEAVHYAESHLRPRAGEFDRNEALPRDVIEDLAAKGFLGAPIPRQYGGLGMNALAYGMLTEAIGKACCSTRTLLTVHTSIVGETLVKMGSPEQKEHYLPRLARGEIIACFALSEPKNGSDANAIQTRYERRGDLYIINGKKKWISFGAIADLFLVIASDSDNDTFGAFLVERGTPGIEIRPMTGMLGNRAAHIAEITFDNVAVPAANIVGKPDTGFNFVVNTALFYGRYSIAWGGLAIAQSALEEMVSYARNREQFGQKIGQFQLIKGLIADAVTQVHAARALCERAGQLRMANDEQAVMETNIAKYFTSKAAVQVASDAVQVFGGNGCWNEYPVERLYRESKIFEIIEGTSQIQQIIIANFGLRKYSRPLSVREEVDI